MELGRVYSSSATGPGPELLVQGWFLLQDAGLDTSENMVMAELKNNFATQRVAQELRNQWSDEDFRRKDQNTRGSIMMASLSIQAFLVKALQSSKQLKIKYKKQWLSSRRIEKR